MHAQEQKEEKENWKYQPNFLVGIDVLNAAVSAFSERKHFEGFVSTMYKNNIHLVANAGFEKNMYEKNGYDARVSGPFVKLGAFYMMLMDPENANNGFYLGGKVASSFYHQEYKKIPVRGFGGSSSSVALPASSQTSIWMEATAGARVQVFSSKLFFDVNVQPRYLAFTTKQDDVKPMVVPGFGRSSTKFNIGFSWNVGYSF